MAIYRSTQHSPTSLEKHKNFIRVSQKWWTINMSRQPAVFIWWEETGKADSDNI